MEAASTGATPARRRFTADEFERLAEVGILDEDDRLELIDGDIVEMTPISTYHAGGVNRLNGFFAGKLGERAVVGIQNPIRLDDFHEPQPDVSVMRPRADAYGHAHPGPDDLLLVVEVAHTSQRYDRGFKAPLYGRYGVPETWVVDLETECVHVFRDPFEDGYRVRSRHDRDETIAPQAFPDLELRVTDVLGPPPPTDA